MVTILITILIGLPLGLILGFMPWVLATWKTFDVPIRQVVKGFYLAVSETPNSTLYWVGRKFPDCLHSGPVAIHWYAGKPEQYKQVAEEMIRRKILYRVDETIPKHLEEHAIIALMEGWKVWPSQEIASWFGEQDRSWYPEVATENPYAHLVVTQ